MDRNKSTMLVRWEENLAQHNNPLQLQKKPTRPKLPKQLRAEVMFFFLGNWRDCEASTENLLKCNQADYKEKRNKTKEGKAKENIPSKKQRGDGRWHARENRPRLASVSA